MSGSSRSTPSLLPRRRACEFFEMQRLPSGPLVWLGWRSSILSDPMRSFFELGALALLILQKITNSMFANSLTFRTPLAKLQTLDTLGVLEIGHFGRLCARGDIPLSPS